jgi:Sec-independent protein secretion pathway component TatC
MMKEDIRDLSQVLKGIPNRVHRVFFPVAKLHSSIFCFREKLYTYVQNLSKLNVIR